jgi:hypothetical protein
MLRTNARYNNISSYYDALLIPQPQGIVLGPTVTTTVQIYRNLLYPTGIVITRECCTNMYYTIMTIPSISELLYKLPHSILTSNSCFPFSGFCFSSGFLPSLFPSSSLMSESFSTSTLTFSPSFDFDFSLKSSMHV